MNENCICVCVRVIFLYPDSGRRDVSNDVDDDDVIVDNGDDGCGCNNVDCLKHSNQLLMEMMMYLIEI